MYQTGIDIGYYKLTLSSGLQIPIFGMTLVLLCVWSYFGLFRRNILHDSFVMFLSVNIIGHFLWCTFQSPGVIEAATSTINKHNTDSSQVCRPSTNYHPDPNSSYCNKCEQTRPARAHHCRICKACIIRYDHHCPWVNNCIGRNNYRSFVLLLWYILIGCTYGVLLLGFDFYKTMKERIALYGWSIRGAENGTGLLDLPLPWIMWNDYRNNGLIDTDVVLRAVFPLLFSVGLVMYWFLGYHMRIILAGFTTLEHMSRPPETINPFDHGARENLRQIIGKSWMKLLIPLPHSHMEYRSVT